MKDFEKEVFVYYYKTNAFQKKIQTAKKVIRRAFDSLPSEKWYVAFSGGKDSTVVFDLVRSEYKDIQGIWNDDEFYLPETIEYIERMKKAGANIAHISIQVQHTEWFTANEGNPATADIYDKYSGVFWGLRAQENSKRKKFLKACGVLHYSQAQGKSKTAGKWTCSPIAWWSTEDVWAYIFGRVLDYNKAYDRLSEMGLPIDKQRIGPYATENALGYGMLVTLKKGWPEEYQYFLAKHPQAAEYV